MRQQSDNFSIEDFSEKKKEDWLETSKLSNVTPSVKKKVTAVT